MRLYLMAVAVDHRNVFKPFDRTQRCKRRSYTQMDSGVFDLFDPTVIAHSLKQAVVAAANIHRSFSTPCLSASGNKVEEDPDTGPRIELIAGRGAPGIRALVVEAAIAMASGSDPVPVQSGLGGAYYLCSRNGDKIAVAKPVDEEPLAMNNPKGYAGRILGQPGLKSSVRIGETGVREVAAYLLDHDTFAGVPPTALVKISHVKFHNENSPTSTVPSPKIASLQRFVDHDFDAGDLGPSGFSVSSVHRIGILDIRLLNLDRHAGNILVKKNIQENNNSVNNMSYASENYAVGAAELIPIDHGLCLPELLDDPYFEWLHWPQAYVPFSESEAEYISRLDPFKDAELLRKELPTMRESSIRVLVLCTIFLKNAVDAGICLSDIGDMMTREFRGMEQDPSVLETLCDKAKSVMKEVSDNKQEKKYDMILAKESEAAEEAEDDDDDIFHFDKDQCGDSTSSTEVLGLPRLLRNSYPPTGKPPKIPVKLSATRSMSVFPQTVLSPLHEEESCNIINGNKDNNDEEEEENGGNEDGEDKNNKVVGGSGLTKSVSFSVSNCNCTEAEGISFSGMNEEEWKLFLESFEKLLPKAFEDRKGMGFKQRLGTSCKF